MYQGQITAFLRFDGIMPRRRELMNAVIEGRNSLVHSINSQVGIGSRQQCLTGISQIKALTSSLDKDLNFVRFGLLGQVSTVLFGL